MRGQSLYHTIQRYRTLYTDKITALPVVILMPHSACDCRCVMCDIWKGNKHLKRLTEEDVRGLLGALKKFGTQRVVMSGGEALLNPDFFTFCDILKREGIKISLLSTGQAIKRHAVKILNHVNDIIISLDGPEAVHDTIRNIPGAFNKLKEGIAAMKTLEPSFRVTGRTVIHRLNFRHWTNIVGAARELGLDQISFLPADVSSQAFNRETPWEPPRQKEILPAREDLPELEAVLREINRHYQPEFQSRFIAESPEKLQKIYQYYAAFYGLNPFPFKKCNAPWVSTVIEADGTVRPCFFHPPLGNIRQDALENILNGEEAVRFRKGLNTDTDPVCMQCVCYLNLSARVNM